MSTWEHALVSTASFLWRRMLSTDSSTMGGTPSTSTGETLDGDNKIVPFPRSDGLLFSSSSHRVGGDWFVTDEMTWRSGKGRGVLKAPGIFWGKPGGKSTAPPERKWSYVVPECGLSSTDTSLQCSQQLTSTCNVIIASSV